MTPIQFSALVQLTDKGEADKAKLVAFYLHKVRGQPSFKLSALVDEMVSFGLSKPNASRLKINLAKSRSFIKADLSTIKLSLKAVEQLIKDFPGVCEKSEEIVTEDLILPESLYTDTRGFVERVAVQVNACYQYNIFDGCAMMMRRLMEILLILCYRHAGRIDEVTEAGGNVKKLAYLIDYAIRNKVIPLTKGTEDVLHEFRALGNYSAHGIEYQCRKTEINKVKQAYRVCIEELLYGSGLKK